MKKISNLVRDKYGDFILVCPKSEHDWLIGVVLVPWPAMLVLMQVGVAEGRATACLNMSAHRQQ